MMGKLRHALHLRMSLVSWLLLAHSIAGKLPRNHLELEEHKSLHSNNYESAIVCKSTIGTNRKSKPDFSPTVGYTRLLADDKEKNEALTRITNHTFRQPSGEEGDRWADSRKTTPTEVSYPQGNFTFALFNAYLPQFKSTRAIAFDIEMASAKVRSGPPHDDKEDLDHASTFW
jgi:hypothetical protein